MIPVELLLQAYRFGIFPMAMRDGSIEWFSPDPRAILPLDKFHVPHGLRRAAAKKVFEIKIDERFGEVDIGASGTALQPREMLPLLRPVANLYEYASAGRRHACQTVRTNGTIDAQASTRHRPVASAWRRTRLV